ncbi:2-oxoacid:acceptor oxidoreductase subunit alpha [Elongatibacter sediminis]|uniref:2-oxoacid:acceptor oxidoreductase subunit alpha n=1 Tax=Elongatibacter sediminis TaxID=3119006 RepID=A0AAW9RJT0_9GAMM
MDAADNFDISLAVTGSGGAGAITAGELLLSVAGRNGCFGMMRRSFGPQIRGGEAAALLRISSQPVACMNDSFDLLLALDWRNAERFADEITLRPDSIIIADPAAGAVPQPVLDMGGQIIAVPLGDLARDIAAGRPNMVALGLLTRWLGFGPDEAGTLITELFESRDAEIASGSRLAFEQGFAQPLASSARQEASTEQPGAPRNSDLPPLNGERWHFHGNEGCGLGALRGGIRFVAAYPITPASDLLEWLSPRLDQLNGSLLQAEDELASINMVLGASFGGVPAMTATSGPGMALMLEGMGLAVASETPAVVINVMRGGPSTGIPTKSEQTDLNMALHGLHGDAPHMVIAPLDHADCIQATEWAVRLSEALQTLTIVLSDQLLAQSTVLIPKPEYRLPDIPPRCTSGPDPDYERYALTDSGVSPMAIPGTPMSTYVADGLEHTSFAKPSAAAADHAQQLDKRARKIASFEYGDLWADSRGTGDTVILTWGSTTAAAREAVRRLETAGHPVRVIALRLLLPARPERLAEALEGARRVLIVEQSHGRQFEHYLRAYYEIAPETRTLARPGPLPITPGEIVESLTGWE